MENSIICDQVVLEKKSIINSGSILSTGVLYIYIYIIIYIGEGEIRKEYR